MIRVKNRRIIRSISRKSLRSNGARNAVAVAAILLTTLLFTALFTIALSINAAFQESNFKQCGGWNHGSFKYLTKEQVEELKSDKGIKEWSVRRILGVAQDAPFNKNAVELGYSDATNAHWMFCDPTEGRLPRNNTNEAATDTLVLSLLGVEPRIGAEFEVSFYVDNIKTSQRFTLCGWWEHDDAIAVSHILLPESRVDSVLNELGVISGGINSMFGSYTLEVMLPSSLNIGQQLSDILARHGYQSSTMSDGDNYIPIGVNWGYTGSQLSDGMDPSNALAIIALLALIVFTGYLIIYNVFRISVVNDIRFYGLLKTVGTTPRQLRRIIRGQALSLCIIGIPTGLAIGFFVGRLLIPIVLSQLEGVSKDTVSSSPLIFILASLFSLGTVLLSSAKPGKMAGRVSPVEALRYAEGDGKKRAKKRTAGVSLPRMAWSNLGRSISKTVITVLSLSLAVLLLTLTVTFTNGFSMDKYIEKNVTTDFVLADATYFKTSSGFDPVSQADIDAVKAFGGIENGGCVYAGGKRIHETVSEEYYRSVWGNWNDEETLDFLVENSEKTDDGQIIAGAELYGMEAFALDKLDVIDGDISSIYEPGSNSIAAVYTYDDYGNFENFSHWAKVGDKVTLTYVDEYRYVDRETGELVDPEVSTDWEFEVVDSHEVTYTVAATVVVPYALSYRYYGLDKFVLNDKSFIRDTGKDEIMLYACDMTDDSASADMESFLENYTKNQSPSCDYESRAKYAAEFESFRSMFIMLGGVLSFIVGLVGILNFFNAVMTGILTRRREFAMLQAIGMTGKQLKTMLICEGIFYALCSILFSLLLTVSAGPLVSGLLETMFWFYSYTLTVTPIFIVLPAFLVLGVLLPLTSYRIIAKQTVVDRLRETE